MTLAYQIMYRLGFTPWEQDEPISDLAELVAGPNALPPGRALDIGCGTGRNAVYCARRGWQVTGIDDVARALQRARQHIDDAGQDVRLIHGDIAGMPEVGRDYSLLLDIGCLHGLNKAQLGRAVTSISRAAAPGATLLMFAIAPGAPKPAPIGIEPDDIQDLFPGWRGRRESVRRRDRHARTARPRSPLRAPPHPSARVTAGCRGAYAGWRGATGHRTR
jgi:SAM-dependent methyltransferase